MTEPRSDTTEVQGGPDDAATPGAPDVATDSPGPAAPDPGLERRAFVRRMGTDAVRTAGTMFSLSRILTRSAVAAGQAVAGELGAIQVGNAAEESLPIGGAIGAGLAADADADAPGIARPVDPWIPQGSPEFAAPATSPLPASTPAPAPAPERPALRPDADQLAILEQATTAVVAVNREGHPPQLTTAAIAWDGATVRFATLGWSRRTTMLRSDPRIGLLVDGPDDGRFVTVTGHARIVEGLHAPVREAAWPLLLREVGGGGEAAAEERWQELLAADSDRAVIVVEPDQILSGRR